MFPAKTWANSADQDQTASEEAAYQGSVFPLTFYLGNTVPLKFNFGGHLEILGTRDFFHSFLIINFLLNS